MLDARIHSPWQRRRRPLLLAACLPAASRQAPPPVADPLLSLTAATFVTHTRFARRFNAMPFYAFCLRRYAITIRFVISLLPLLSLPRLPPISDCRARGTREFVCDGRRMPRWRSHAAPRCHAAARSAECTLQSAAQRGKDVKMFRAMSDHLPATGASEEAAALPPPCPCLPVVNATVQRHAQSAVQADGVQKCV